jgi:hypothetical protein
MSAWLKRLPGFQRAAPGLEWQLWRRLPSIFIAGTLLPLAVAMLARAFSADSPVGEPNKALQLFDYAMVGVVMLHWTLVLTLAIGCAIVMVMKGPAFVADAYPLPERDDESRPG